MYKVYAEILNIHQVLLSITYGLRVYIPSSEMSREAIRAFLKLKISREVVQSNEMVLSVNIKLLRLMVI